MKQSLFTLEHTRQLGSDIYELVLSGDTSAITAPGQFVNIALPGNFLRRPISVCNWTEHALMLLVRVVGEGTHTLVRSVPGTELDVLSGLGNGFDMSLAGEHPVLAGGGIGIAPLYGLAQRMLEQYSQQITQPGIPFEQSLAMTGLTVDMLREQAMEGALRQVKVDLALSAVAKAEGIEVTDADIDEECKRLGEQYHMDAEKVKKIVPLGDLKNDLTNQKAANVIFDSAKVGKAPEKKAEEPAAKGEEKKPAKKTAAKKTAKKAEGEETEKPAAKKTAKKAEKTEE